MKTSQDASDEKQAASIEIELRCRGAKMSRGISISWLAADLSCLASWLAMLSATPAGPTE